MPDKARNPRASLIESIPGGLESLRGTPGVQYTKGVFVRLSRAAQSTIDLIAMYWALLPDPKGVDEKGFTNEQFRQMEQTWDALFMRPCATLHVAAFRFESCGARDFQGKRKNPITSGNSSPNAFRFTKST